MPSAAARLRRFYGYLRPHRGLMALLAALSFLAQVAILPVALLVRQIIDRSIPRGDIADLFTTVAIIVGCWLVGYMAHLLAAYAAAWLREAVLLGVRNELYEHVQLLDPQMRGRRLSGGFLARLMGDVKAVHGLLSDQLFEAGAQLLFLVGVVVILATLHLHLCLVAITSIPALFVVFQLFRGRIYRTSKVLQEREEELSSRMQENLSGLQLIQILGLEERKADEMGRLGQELRAVSVRRQLLASSATMASAVVTVVPVAGLVWGYGGYLVLQGRLSIGTLVAFMFYAGAMFEPLGKIARYIVDGSSALAAADRVFEILDARPTVEDRPGAKETGRVVGEIALKGVSLDYVADDGPGSTKKVTRALSSIDLTIPEGQTVGIVGHSGAGKTSLIRLLLRMYDVTEGSIELDGVDLRELKLSSLRRAIGVVSQEVFLFSTTVRENIRLALPEVSEDRLEEAARRALVLEFVESLPDGLDTVVGERGERLSGGQRQRLALARAIVRDPPILIFDEATSALDVEAERRLHEALGQVIRGRTTIIVAHRLSTLRLVERVIVLEEGRVVGDGRHDELLRSCPSYALMCELQSGPAAAPTAEALAESEADR